MHICRSWWNFDSAYVAVPFTALRFVGSRLERAGDVFRCENTSISGGFEIRDIEKLCVGQS